MGDVAGPEAIRGAARASELRKCYEIAKAEKERKDPEALKTRDESSDRVSACSVMTIERRPLDCTPVGNPHVPGQQRPDREHVSMTEEDYSRRRRQKDLTGGGHQEFFELDNAGRFIDDTCRKPVRLHPIPRDNKTIMCHVSVSDPPFHQNGFSVYSFVRDLYGAEERG